MPPIRNHAVAQGQQAANSNTIVYTVPTGYVFLLKSVVAQTPGATTNVAVITLVPAGTVFGIQFVNQSLAVNQVVNWSGWIPMNEGDVIYVGTGASVLNYWIGGALLPQIPGF